MFVVGFVYSIIGLLLSYMTFKEVSGLLMIFLIVMASLPVIFSLIKNEEELDLQVDNEMSLLKEHTKVIYHLVLFFFGITLALFLAYLFMPQQATEAIFSLQQSAIKNVNVNIQASVTGAIAKLDLFSKIFINNIKVLFFCIVFSFLYGSGAIFILTWNASVIATAMGSLVKSEIGKTAAVAGLPALSAYFGISTFSFFRYMTHGIFEIVAYFVAGLAGGIISIALIKHNLKEHKVLVDSLDLVLISVGLLFIAGIVEVYITPLFF